MSPNGYEPWPVEATFNFIWAHQYNDNGDVGKVMAMIGDVTITNNQDRPTIAFASGGGNVPRKIWRYIPAGTKTGTRSVGGVLWPGQSQTYNVSWAFSDALGNCGISVNDWFLGRANMTRSANSAGWDDRPGWCDLLEADLVGPAR